MDILDAIKNRASVRAYLNKPVPKELVIQLLDIAKYAPSGVNTQPWQVTIVGEQSKKIIAEQIIFAKESGVSENPDYPYYPKTWVEPYKSRRKACGVALYGALNIRIEETERRKAAWYRNYSFFDAPLALIIHIDKALEIGSWLDTGMFIQNILLTARGLGLESCPQAALAEYPDIIRKVLDIPPSQQIVCGIAIGYADWSAPINHYRTTRESIDIFSRWVD